MAVILTDALQFVVLTLGLTLCLILVLVEYGGLNALWEQVQALPDIGHKMSFTADWTTGAVVMFIITYGLGEFLAPYNIQRYSTAKDARQSRKSAVCFALFCGVFTVTIPTTIGYASLISLPDVHKDLALTGIIQQLLPIGIEGLVFGGLLAAVMSSGDSFLNTSALAFTKDVYATWINPNADDNKLLKVTKTTTVITGAASIVMALSYPDIFGLLVRAYYYWIPTMILPLLIAILYKGALAKYSGPIGMLVGLATALIWGLGLNDPGGLHYAIAGFIANGIAMLVVQLVSKKEEAQAQEA